jgi:hypothetical protein
MRCTWRLTASPDDGDTEIGSVILEQGDPVFREQIGTVGIYRVMQDYQLAHIEEN